MQMSPRLTVWLRLDVPIDGDGVDECLLIGFTLAGGNGS